MRTTSLWLASRLLPQVSWHDLAFHDPVMYESMRKLIIDAKENGDSLTGIGNLPMCSHFCNSNHFAFSLLKTYLGK